MRRPVRLSPHLFERICPKCSSNLVCGRYSSSLTRCEICSEHARIFTCTGLACKFSEKICISCGYSSRKSEKNIKLQGVDSSDRRITNNINTNIKWGFYAVLLVLCVVVILIFIPSKSHEDMTVAEIKRLKSYYISQKNETWHHLLSVLEKKIPSVKSITFLHGEDKKTLNCLTNELVSLYTTNSKIKLEEITFSLSGSEIRDYGFFLEHYHSVVEKFRVLITDLSRVPGDIARLFHSLCDEESSDIKPSLFIFTLKYDTKTADLKPLERATTILKEAWGNLPQNEIFPLLSRIIKNVVDVVPEQEVNCLF